MYADGDPIGVLPVRVRAVRGAVNVLVPAQAESASAFALETAAESAGAGSQPASATPGAESDGRL
jgi:hypothetical protein